MQVYVRNRNKQALMPCSPRTARRLLDAGKAKVVARTPYTIALLHGASGYRQQVVAALDTGSKTLGSAAVANGAVIYQAEVTLRNDITGKMEQRRSYRRTRRGRQTRYRPARFDNRSASTRKGRLPPSLRSKVDSHLREVRFIESILPVSQWKFELAAFDIHKITHPGVVGVGYQQGMQKDYYNVKAYVLHRDGYRCQAKRKVQHSKKLHVHHIVFRSHQGSDAPDNLITLCETCHHDLHAGMFDLPKKRTRASTRHATQIGIVKAQLATSGVAHEAVFGYETRFRRERLGWPKTHALDAAAACLEDGEMAHPMDTVLVKAHVARGDYKQTAGAHSQLRLPTGKLFGMRKFDKVELDGRVGFIKGKRSTGYFAISDIAGNSVHASAKVASLKRLSARSSTLVQTLLIDHHLSRRSNMDAQRPGKTTMAAPSAPFLSAVNGDVSRSKA